VEYDNLQFKLCVLELWWQEKKATKTLGNSK